MDKSAKSLLEYIVKSGGCDKSVSFGSELDSLASKLNVKSESLRATVRYLHDLGYIDYQKYSGSDKNAAFALSHKGENWKYFQRLKVLDYLADKWIDFFAFVVSVGALIISLISLFD